MNSSDIAKTLSVVFGNDQPTIPYGSPEWMCYQALYNFSQNKDEDDQATLALLGLDEISLSVLIDGHDLVTAGKAASNGRYATDIQARAYAVAQLHTAARVLIWNHKIYAPHRKMSAQLVKRYHQARAELRAKITIPAKAA